VRRLSDGEGLGDPEPFRWFYRESRKIRGPDPGGVAGLVLIAARNSPDCTAAEQDGELLSHLTARRDDHVVGIGEQPGEPGDLDLHTGLLSGLPTAASSALSPTSTCPPGSSHTPLSDRRTRSRAPSRPSTATNTDGTTRVASGAEG